MRRYNMLPSYHFEDSVNGIIEKPVESDMRDYIIEGNCGKNLIPSIPEKAFNGVTLSKVDDYYVLNGTCTESTNYVPFSIIIPAGTYTISANNPVTNNTDTAIIQLYNPGLEEMIAAWDSKISATATKTMTGSSYQFRIRVQKGITYDNFIIKPQLEIGNTATEYEPYKTVGELSPNLIPYPYAQTTKTVNGITFTDNGDGSVSINGTNTGTGATNFFLYQNNKSLIPNLNIGDTFVLSVDKKQVPTGLEIALNYWDSTPKQYTGKTLTFYRVRVFGTVGENWVGIYLYIKVLAGATIDTTIKIQLEVGDTATDYVPYGKYKLPVVVGGKNLLTFSSEALTFTKFIDKKVDIPAGRYLLSWSSSVLGGDSSPALRFNANNIVTMLTKTGDCHLVTFTQPENRIMMYSNGYGYDNSEGITSTVDQLMLRDITDLPNLIPYPYYSTTKTINGVTFTDNGDGSITVNGTNNIDGSVFYKILEKTKFSAGTYVLTGCPSGGSTSNYLLKMNFYDENDAILDSLTTYDIGNGAVKYFSENYNIRIYIRIMANTTVENLVFKPKLVKISTDYEPYITPTTTNIIRDNPLKPGESISYRADNLPSVTLKKNVTNTVKVDTEIQPKSVKWQYYTY